MALPSGKEYDSCDENDGPTGEILEDAALVGVEERCPVSASRRRHTCAVGIATRTSAGPAAGSCCTATMTRALEWARCCLRECPRSTPTTRVKARSEPHEERSARCEPGTGSRVGYGEQAGQREVPVCQLPHALHAGVSCRVLSCFT